MGFQIDNNDATILKYLQKGEFGLEKESLRVNSEGFLSHTPHPFIGDPKRDRDFCENQVEMITGVHDSIADVLAELREIHVDTVKTLLELQSGTEYLWPFSNPPYVKGEEDIPIANFTGELSSKKQYREYLAQKYGKMKMLFSGIHFNFSFPEKVLQEDFKRKKLTDYKEYKNQVYLDLAGKVLEYSWLIVYLTAASPVVDGSFVSKEQLGQPTDARYASYRCSKVGYWNHFLPVLDFSSLDAYIDSIEAYMKDGQLRESSELYFPVRLKPRGDNKLETLRAKGVNHIELRMLDLNPLTLIGIDERDLEFIFALLVYLSLKPEENIMVTDQATAIRNMKEAAKMKEEEIQIELGWDDVKPITQAAREVLDTMEQVLLNYFPAEQLKKILLYQKEKIGNPEKRYADRIAMKYQESFVKNGMDLVKQYADVLSRE